MKPAEAVVDLRRSKEDDLDGLLSDVLASCPDPLFVVDADGVVLRANPAADQLRARLELAPEAVCRIEPVLGGVRLLDDAGPPSPFNASRVGDLASLVLSESDSEEPVYDLRLTRRASSNSNRPGFIVQLVDATPLISALRGQAAASRHRDGIVKLLSHDLRSPHAAILATLNHADFASVPANLRQIIERAARRSLNMVDSLVRSVRAESSDYQLEPIDLIHVLEEVSDSIWNRASENNVRITFEDSVADRIVLADRGMITRAITGVLDGLVKFSVAGQPIKCRLEAGVLAERPAVVCEFAATVRQISNGELARIFSRFAASQRGDVGSLGDTDGLQLIRTVVERHHGSVTCCELSGARRTVTITLPLAERASDQASDENWA